MLRIFNIEIKSKKISNKFKVNLNKCSLKLINYKKDNIHKIQNLEYSKLQQNMEKNLMPIMIELKNWISN